MVPTKFEEIFGWLPVPKFRRRRAVERIIRKLPQCSASIVVASPDYGIDHYNCDVIANVKGILQWMNGYESSTWRPGPYQVHRRVALYTWFSKYDPTNASTLLLPSLFADLLQSDVPLFVESGVASVYCRDCKAVYNTIQTTRSNEAKAGPYTSWTEEWRCSNGHLLYLENHKVHMLRYLGSEIDELEKVSLVTVHIRDALGEHTTQWKIGADVTFKDFLAARDPDSGDLYAVTENLSGNEQTRLCGKDEWHKLEYDTEEAVRTREDQIIKVHILDPRGNYSTTWRIGEDISTEVVQQARDIQSSALYAMITLEDGKASTHVLKKQLWLRAKEQFDSIDQQGTDAMARTRKAHPESFEPTNNPERDSDASRAPIGRILPSFVPVILERGLPGYASDALTAGEIRVPMKQLRPLLVAATFIGAWDYAGSQGFDSDAVQELLVQSLRAIPDLMPHEVEGAVDIVGRFLSFNVIRSEHSLDDWLCEAMWPAFQATPYRYPSAMSNALSYALGIRDALGKTTLEY